MIRPDRGGASLSEKEYVATLEKRVVALEASIKKAGIVAVVAAVLGGSGVVGVIQLWTAAPLQSAEVALKKAETALKQSEVAAKQYDLTSRPRFEALELAQKQTAQQISETDLKLKGLEQHKEEFAIRLKQHDAVTTSLEKAIKAIQSDARGGDPAALRQLLEELGRQNQAFLQFATQTESYVQQLPGTPGWYQGAVQQVKQAAQTHQQELSKLQASIPAQP
jgi:chromosome segregation ATPase